MSPSPGRDTLSVLGFFGGFLLLLGWGGEGRGDVLCLVWFLVFFFICLFLPKIPAR